MELSSRRRSADTTIALPLLTTSKVAFVKSKNNKIIFTTKLFVEWGSAMVLLALLLLKNSVSEVTT